MSNSGRRLEQTFLAQPFDKRRTIEFQKFRGHGFVAARALERPLNETIFNFFQNGIEVDAFTGECDFVALLMLRNGIIDDIVGQIAGPDDPVIIEHDQALDQHFQLPNIARPTISLQCRHRAAVDLQHSFGFTTGVKL
jgi:hypothetical protein